MPVAMVHPIRLAVSSVSTVLFLLLGVLLLVPETTSAGMVLPLQGGGNFHTSVDVVNRWQDNERLDVLVMVEVSNASLGYDHEDRGFVGRLRVEVEFVGPDGQTVTEKRPFHTPPLSREEAATATLFQNFGLIIEDIPFRSARFKCRVYDVNRRKEGLLNSMRKENVRSECSADWFAPDSPRHPVGVSLGDPLYLFQAPLDRWNPSNTRGQGGGWLHDYMHPSRRYGIEQDHLQLFVPVWPPTGGVHSAESTDGIVLQLVSLDMAYGITDTLTFDQRGLTTLEAGLPAGLFYSLDVNLLPEGSYRLSMAPLGGHGRAVVSGFDVIWRLDTLGRHRDMVLAEGHLVFEGDLLNDFKAASPAEQEKMLDLFWDAHNPDPENPVNEAYLEFQYRMGYVQQFLGGFLPTGPADDRGVVFIMLGPADEVQSEKLPMNFRDQDDARIKVYQRFAPDRSSVWSKGGSEGGTQNIDPYAVTGGIPMPYSHRAQTQREAVAGSARHDYGFELWKYDGLGKPLFENRFSRSSMGTRFLFVDRTGTGDFFLESSNVIQGEE
jgi:GWxTD domain-containing protein